MLARGRNARNGRSLPLSSRVACAARGAGHPSRRFACRDSLGNGEHNANFAFDHPVTGARYVLRMNYASQLGLREQASYEHGALRALAVSGRTPSAVYVDETRSVVDRGVQVIGFCAGRLLDLERDDDLSKAAKSLADVHSVSVPDECTLIRPRNPLAEIRDESLRMYRVYAGRGSSMRTWRARSRTFLQTCDRRGGSARGRPDALAHREHTECIAAHFLIPECGRLSPTWSTGKSRSWAGRRAGRGVLRGSHHDVLGQRYRVRRCAPAICSCALYIDSVDGRFPTEGFVERFFAYLTLTCLRGVTWCAMAQVEYHDPNRPLKNDKYVSQDSSVSVGRLLRAVEMPGVIEAVRVRALHDAPPLSDLVRTYTSYDLLLDIYY